MTEESRRARVLALAKINLGLRVLYQRPDQFHELRTIYQTISLADTIDVTFTPGPKSAVELRSSVDIPDNLVVKAARMVLDALRVAGRVAFRLKKRIPIGAGLGGGSSDAAAVLLALPVLAGGGVPLDVLIRIAVELGSDVPFFLLGGTAVGVGRGEELYPLPDAARRPGLLLAPPIQVPTADAYRWLSPRLTSESQKNSIVSFQSQAWSVEANDPAWAVNDFESVVFERFPRLRALKQRLSELGAWPALMTGSGSGIFGLFRAPDELNRALIHFGEDQVRGLAPLAGACDVLPISLVSRRRYRSLWWRRLQPHINENVWPPQSRYAQ
jgi:4-diphosphocytidyl-2-C-methyl-D-erythritol kinase